MWCWDHCFDPYATALQSRWQSRMTNREFQETRSSVKTGSGVWLNSGAKTRHRAVLTLTLGPLAASVHLHNKGRKLRAIVYAALRFHWFHKHCSCRVGTFPSWLSHCLRSTVLFLTWTVTPKYGFWFVLSILLTPVWVIYTQGQSLTLCGSLASLTVSCRCLQGNLASYSKRFSAHFRPYSVQ